MQIALFSLNLLLVGLAHAFYVWAFSRDGMRAVLFFWPFSMSPFAVHLVWAFLWHRPICQALLAWWSVLYAAWFAFIYVSAVYLYPDPQSPIVFVFVGFFALIALVPLWVLGFGLEFRSKRQSMAG